MTPADVSRLLQAYDLLLDRTISIHEMVSMGSADEKARHAAVCQEMRRQQTLVRSLVKS